MKGVLYVVVCGAGPASRVGILLGQAQRRGYEVCLIATAAAVQFLDLDALTAQTGRPVRTDYGRGERLPRAAGVIVAPATYNTINKWAAGVADSYPLTLLAELTGLGVPTVVLPFMNTALAANRVFLRSVHDLRMAGVHVLFGPGEFEPHLPGSGGTQIESFPWHSPLDVLERVLSTADS